jgi:hypothetical protein
MDEEKEPEAGGLKQTDTKMTAIKTSQTEFSLCEGKSSAGATPDKRVSEGSQGRGDFTRTSQQINGELSLVGERNIQVR